MNRKIKILFRWLGILLLLLLLLLVAAYFLVQNPKVQTKLVQYYTEKLSKDLNTKVEVGDVDIDFFNAVTINGIYIEDLNQDTLFYAGKIHSKAILFKPLKLQFALANSTMEDVTIRLRRSPNDSLSNLNQLFAAQSKDTTATKTAKKNKKQLGLAFTDITIKNFDFSFQDSLKHKATDFRVAELKTDFKTFDLQGKNIQAKYLNASEPFISLVNTEKIEDGDRSSSVFSLPEDWKFGVTDVQLVDGQFISRSSPKKPGKEDIFAFNNFHWNPFTLIAENLEAKDDQLDMDIKKLQFVDETGFRVDEFSADASINPDDIVLDSLSILLDKSIIAGDIKMNYRDFKNFSDFENKIRLNADVKQIKLMPREFRLLFGSDILKEPVTISGQLQGKLSNLSTQNFYLKYENGALVRGDIDARGLPDLQNTFFDAKIEELRVTQRGLQQIMGRTKVPEQIQRLGNISFTGDFLGYITDLVAYGDLDTDIGDLNVDVKYTTDERNNPVYSGYIETLTDFDLGYWLQNSDLGLINFAGGVTGKNFDLNTMQATVDADVKKFDYKGNTINNINLQGELNNKVLTATADVNDELFVGVVNVNSDFSLPVAEHFISADVEKGDLYALGLMKSPFEVEGKFTADLTGNSISEMQWNIDAQDAVVKSDGKSYELGDISFSVQMKDGKQSVLLTSENASAEFIGNYNYTQLYPTLLKTINEYYDFRQGWENLENTVETNEEIEFNVKIKPNSKLTKLILPDIQLSSAVNAEGILNPFTDEISMLALADSLSYKDYTIDNWQLDSYGDGKVLYINSFQDAILNKNKKWLTDSDLAVELSRDDILVNVETRNEDFLSAKLGSRIKRNGDEFQISILQSDLVVNGEAWSIQEGNSITLGGGTWKAENFVLQNGEQRITIYNPPDSKETKLIANVDKLEMTDLNGLIGFTQKPFDGQISGDVNLIDYQDGLNLDVNLIIRDFLYNNDVVDIISLEGLYNLDTQVGSFDGVANDSDFQFILDAKLDAKKPKDILEIDIDIVKSALSPFENLFNTSISDVDGYIDGKMKVVGGPKTFNLSGEVNIIEDVFATLNFTQARYKIPANQKLDIVWDGFLLKNLKMYDQYGSEAILNGEITHTDLSNFTLNINGKYENFLLLNTTSRDNEIFNGKAFASGDLFFTGPIEDAFMQVNAVSEPNTQINIQTPSARNTGKYSFIRFRQPEVDTIAVQEEEKSKSKLTMRFDLDVTSDAKVNMSFDSEGYNTIEGNGYGNLIIDIDTEDLFNINGLYTVNQGAYVVNFKDILERKFKVQPGGIIQWYTDPYKANLKIVAEHKLEADVSALTSNANTYLADAITTITVNIGGNIAEPKFDYSIDVDRAKAGSELRNNLRIINNDETKLDNQIGSLLLLGQFSSINSDPFSTQRSLEGLAINSVTNILTNQLSSLLTESGILENTQIGIDYDNYRNEYDDFSNVGLDQKLQLQLSSRFLNDRIEIEYGGDFNFGDGLDRDINTFQVGDFVFTYSLNERGNYKFKLFSLRDYSIIQQRERRRNGFGFIIEKDFNNFKELFEKEQKSKDKEEEKEDQNLPPEQQPAVDPAKEEED